MSSVVFTPFKRSDNIVEQTPMRKSFLYTFPKKVTEKVSHWTTAAKVAVIVMGILLVATALFLNSDWSNPILPSFLQTSIVRNIVCWGLGGIGVTMIILGLFASFKRSQKEEVAKIVSPVLSSKFRKAHIPESNSPIIDALLAKFKVFSMKWCLEDIPDNHYYFKELADGTLIIGYATPDEDENPLQDLNKLISRDDVLTYDLADEKRILTVLKEDYTPPADSSVLILIPVNDGQAYKAFYTGLEVISDACSDGCNFTVHRSLTTWKESHFTYENTNELTFNITASYHDVLEIKKHPGKRLQF